MIGGLIQGSNDSATTAFTTLATISSASAGWNEIVFANTTPYRWVKYVGPSGSFGQVAELEFYSDAARLEGDGFGTAGSRSGNPWQNALDGTTETFFDGPESVDVYVGLDAAAGHVTATPQVSPAGGQVPQIVTLSSATPGATVRYTLDGSDPATGIVYTGPISITSSATVRAIATAPCNVRSAVATQAFTASPATNVSVDVIGNSLTDSVDSGYLQAIAAAGGVNLDYARHTVPGIGTYIYPENGAGVRSYITTNSRDHVTMQPAANMPCLPTGGDPAPGVNASDATNIDLMWDEAVTRNPATRVWVYQTWSAPNAYTNCIAGGAWLRDPRIWNPPAPTSWEAATNNFGAYAEAVRAGIMSLNPTRPTPYVIPGGRALVALKAAVEAGRLPGVAANGFFPFVYSLAYGDDDHLTEQGRYFITLVFYACMFQRDPRALPDTNLGTAATLTAGQAAMLQQVVYEVVSEYPLSGFLR